MTETDKLFNFVSRMQKGGRCVRVWGCMTSAETGPLVLSEGRMKGSTYIEIHDEVLPRFIRVFRNTERDKHLHIQDNAPPHKSKFAIKRFERNNIPLLA